MADKYIKKIKSPEDVKSQISDWIAFACKNNKLPFESGHGGIIVQMLNVWLKAHDSDKITELEKRLAALENGEHVKSAVSGKQKNGSQKIVTEDKEKTT